MLFFICCSQKPCMWSGSIWNARGMLTHLSAQQQLQNTDLSLPDGLQLGKWWQVMQKYVVKIKHFASSYCFRIVFFFLLISDINISNNIRLQQVKFACKIYQIFFLSIQVFLCFVLFCDNVNEKLNQAIESLNLWIPGKHTLGCF